MAEVENEEVEIKMMVEATEVENEEIEMAVSEVMVMVVVKDFVYGDFV